MKGSVCEDGSTWRGNPAKAIASDEVKASIDEEQAIESIVDQVANINEPTVEAAE